MPTDVLKEFYDEVISVNQIDPEAYASFDVKRGLRNKDGSGVLAGLTRISSVKGSEIKDGALAPCEGALSYRGLSIFDITKKVQEIGRFGFEASTFLLLNWQMANGHRIE